MPICRSSKSAKHCKTNPLVSLKENIARRGVRFDTLCPILLCATDLMKIWTTYFSNAMRLCWLLLDLDEVMEILY